jgi:hypothetical protein
MDFPNLDLLESAAEKLRPLLPEIVFVGGCATGLLISDPGAGPVRRTSDVDVISEIASYADYAVFSQRLRVLGFTEDSREDAPVCRWLHGELILDVMPLEDSILGFSSRWYAGALRTAVEIKLPSGIRLKTITAPYFLGTKIEAFHGRGNADYLASHALKTSSRSSMDARLYCKRLGHRHMSFGLSLRRPCAAFSQLHGSLMRCLGISPRTPRAKPVSCLSRRSSKR